MKTVILAAGFGSRLWPLSTSEHPKQFQSLLGDESLLQYTYRMLRGVTPADELYVLTRQGLEYLVHQHLPGIEADAIISVPDRRNTLPHVTAALRQIADSDDEPILFSTVDHHVPDQAVYVQSLRKALSSTIDTEAITVLCIKLTTFDANAGYAVVDADNHVRVYKEKPDQAYVDQLAAEGTLYKDTASFIISRRALRSALRGIEPHVRTLLTDLLTVSAGQFEELFLSLPVLDIQTNLFEKADNLFALCIEGEFIDMGRYSALYQVLPKDDRANAVLGDVMLQGDCTRSLIINRSDRSLIAIDAKDAVIVQTPEGNLYAPLAEANRVGEIYKSRIYRP